MTCQYFVLLSLIRPDGSLHHYLYTGLLLVIQSRLYSTKCQLVEARSQKSSNVWVLVLDQFMVKTSKSSYSLLIVCSLLLMFLFQCFVVILNHTNFQHLLQVCSFQYRTVTTKALWFIRLESSTKTQAAGPQIITHMFS